MPDFQVAEDRNYDGCGVRGLRSLTRCGHITKRTESHFRTVWRGRDCSGRFPRELAAAARDRTLDGSEIFILVLQFVDSTIAPLSPCSGLLNVDSPSLSGPGDLPFRCHPGDFLFETGLARKTSSARSRDTTTTIREIGKYLQIQQKKLVNDGEERTRNPIERHAVRPCFPLRSVSGPALFCEIFRFAAISPGGCHLGDPS